MSPPSARIFSISASVAGGADLRSAMAESRLSFQCSRCICQGPRETRMAKVATSSTNVPMRPIRPRFLLVAISATVDLAGTRIVAILQVDQDTLQHPRQAEAENHRKRV